jgi:hypothetical protein
MVAKSGIRSTSASAPRGSGVPSLPTTSRELTWAKSPRVASGTRTRTGRVSPPSSRGTPHRSVQIPIQLLGDRPVVQPRPPRLYFIHRQGQLGQRLRQGGAGMGDSGDLGQLRPQLVANGPQLVHVRAVHPQLDGGIKGGPCSSCFTSTWTAGKAASKSRCRSRMVPRRSVVSPSCTMPWA